MLDCDPFDRSRRGHIRVKRICVEEFDWRRHDEFVQEQGSGVIERGETRSEAGEVRERGDVTRGDDSSPRKIFSWAPAVKIPIKIASRPRLVGTRTIL